MVLAGLITHPLVSVFGAVTLVMGLVGWFRAVLPREALETVPLEHETGTVLTPGREVRHLQIGEQGHRVRLPLEVYPYSAGLRGGLVGGAAMALLAVLYGLIGHKSIWYPINLLAAAGSAKISAMSYEQLLAFSGTGLVLASVIHIAASALVGLLYATQDIIDPTLNARIDWPWFMAFQFVFGVVAGLVVARHARVFTLQYLPIAVRLGVEAPGFMAEKNGEEPKP
jgi:hypothetical protein